MSLSHQSRDGFLDILGQFLDACLVVWPEDAALKDYKAGFTMIMNPALGAIGEQGKDKLVREYHESLSPFYQRAAQKDVTLFTEERIPILEEVNLREKWLDNSISESTRETIWAYVLEMNRLAQMHCSLFSKIPEGAMGRIQSVSNDLAAKLQSGQLNMNELDLASIGQDVVAGMSEQELEGFMQSVLSDPAAIANLASSFGGRPLKVVRNIGLRRWVTQWKRTSGESSTPP